MIRGGTDQPLPAIAAPQLTRSTPEPRSGGTTHASLSTALGKSAPPSNAHAATTAAYPAASRRLALQRFLSPFRRTNRCCTATRFHDAIPRPPLRGPACTPGTRASSPPSGPASRQTARLPLSWHRDIASGTPLRCYTVRSTSQRGCARAYTYAVKQSLQKQPPPIDPQPLPRAITGLVRFFFHSPA
jgi:hypothetical protein